MEDNELIGLEIMHRYVEVLDKWFMNVCELDIIFNFQQAYAIIDEVLITGSDPPSLCTPYAIFKEHFSLSDDNSI